MKLLCSQLVRYQLAFVCSWILVIAGVSPAQQPRLVGDLSLPRAGHPATGNVDLANSRVFIFVGKTGLGHDHGVEGRLAAGTINLGVDQQAGAILFDMTSFDADTVAARKYVGLAGTTNASTRKQVNTNMKGPAVLDVKKFPTARFDIQSARLLQQKSSRDNPVYQLSGEFTLHGKKQPLRLNAEAVQEHGVTCLRGMFAIRQSEFGIKPFSKAFGAVGVADELRIYGDIVMEARGVVADSGSTFQGVQR